jgi:hypothetical protein
MPEGQVSHRNAIVLTDAIPGRIDAGVVKHEPVAGVAEPGELALNRLQIVVPVGEHDAGVARVVVGVEGVCRDIELRDPWLIGDQ